MQSHVSIRTLILGVNQAGRIVQHDRGTAEIISTAGGPLLGAHLREVVADQSAERASLDAILDALAAGREQTAVLSVRTHRAPVDAVVSVQPMHSTGSDLAALVIMRVPPLADEQFLDPAVMRHAILDDTFRHIGATLDLDQMARGLVNVVVPHFCNSASLLVPESLLTADGPVPHAMSGPVALRRLATASDARGTGWEAAFPVGEVVRYPPGFPQSESLATGRPALRADISADHAAEVAESWLRSPMTRALAGVSMLVLPLATGNESLGLIVCVRRAGFRQFDAYDAEIGMEFAARAATYISTAHRFTQERTTALTLQRSLLPTGLSAPSSVELGHRYLPGSQLVEVGGDWYESISLPGARAALVTGDVAGHGVQAAVTMGRLRTAIQTLAMLELSPAESLQQLDDLIQSMGEPEPYLATCVYATYDAVRGRCEIASAGHPPPLLVTPDGTARFLEVTPAPPLGISNGHLQNTFVDIEDGSLLILYTDGLVEHRGSDIDEGLTRLRSAFSRPGLTTASVDELCQVALASAYGEHQRDDIAVLVARLRRIDASRYVTWELPDELTSAGRARGLVREPLERWGLLSLLAATELTVSELVTNAIRYTEGPVTLRLIHDRSLVCEVHDSSPALPRLHYAGQEDEWGRGLEIVSQISHRWGARRQAGGKVVWSQQQIPREAGG